MNNTVVIAGAGLAGMRAAVELLGQGLSVILVEVRPAIGGLLADVDRLFPTGERASGALGPLYAGLSTDPRLELLLGAELSALSGAPGGFTAAISADGDGSRPPGLIERKAGAVIIATGVEEYADRAPTSLGAGQLDNVLTLLEFERRQAAAAAAGEPVRRSDGRVPATVAWVVPDHAFPVPVLPAAMAAASFLERRPDAKAHLLHGQQGPLDAAQARFLEACAAKGVHVERVSSVEIGTSRDGLLVMSYADDHGTGRTLAADMAVVAAPLAPSQSSRAMCERIGVAADARGFVLPPAGGLLTRTSREGVFVCGAASGLKPSNEVLIEACAAASQAAALLRRPPAS